VSGYGLTGRQAESALVDASIVTNRNSIPRDPNGAWYTSGIRLGTPALTTRGLGPADMDDIAGFIDTILASTRPAAGPDGTVSRARYSLDEAVASKVAAQVAEMLAAYPLYPSVELP
jgi:glycine hydroxymethyltransferase